MKGIVITTQGELCIEDFGAPLYETVGAAVGGLIELVRPEGLEHPLCMIVNDEGLIKNLPFNSVGSFLYRTHLHGNPILGNIVIMKTGFTDDGPDIVGLTDDEAYQLSRKFKIIFSLKEKKQ